MITLWEKIKSFFTSLFTCTRCAPTTAATTVEVTETPAPVAKSDPSHPKLRYLLNDPETPEFSVDIDLPELPSPCPHFNVVKFDPGRLNFGTSQWRSAQVFTVLAKTIGFMQGYFMHPVSKWSSTSVLKVYPEFDVDLNAYYDRTGLKFFYAADPITKSVTFSSESVDVVAHELGHALLDSIRPDLWSMQSLEVWSFHESWGDMVAMLSVMQSEKMMQVMLDETNGDILRSNSVSRLAEQMGRTIYDYTGGKDGHRPDCLRDAVNTFTYVHPETLPSSTTDDKLAAECHSFSRVFTGAFYEVLGNIYHREVANGKDKMQALIHARETLGSYIAKAALIAPASVRFYSAVANSLLTIDRQKGGAYQDIIRNVFANRKILGKSPKLMQAMSLETVNLTDADVVMKENDITAIRLKKPKTIKLADHVGMREQDNNPLYNCNIEVPDDHFMEFDKMGMLVSSHKSSDDDVVKNAQSCISYLHEKDLVGVYDEKKPTKQFSIQDGNLVRNYMICGCKKCCHHR